MTIGYTEAINSDSEFSHEQHRTSEATSQVRGEVDARAKRTAGEVRRALRDLQQRYRGSTARQV